MEEQVKKVLAEIMKQKGMQVLEITNSSDLNDDLGLDSLDTLTMTFDIEEKFLIKIPKKYRTFHYKTVQDIIDVVREVQKGA